MHSVGCVVLKSQAIPSAAFSRCVVVWETFSTSTSFQNKNFHNKNQFLFHFWQSKEFLLHPHSNPAPTNLYLMKSQNCQLKSMQSIYL